MEFACKRIDFEDLVKCSFGLNKTEYNLFIFLLEQNESLCAATIGEMTQRDRTTVQKAIKKLVSKGLVQKHQVNLNHGGYTFVYKIKNKEYLRTTILDIINKWHENVIKTVQNW